MKLLLLTLFGVISCLTTFGRPKSIEIIICDSLTAREHYYMPFYSTFDVPKGATKIVVEQSFRSSDGKRANLDLGVFDARGRQFGTDGFRGWSGGARRSFEISESIATPGYLPGKLNVGTWSVVQMSTELCDKVYWTLRVTITIGGDRLKPHQIQPARSEINAHRGWYRFDTHVHTCHSDGKHTPQEIVDEAQRAGLDGIFSTDHNTTSALGEWGAVQPDSLLIVNGVEVTFGSGHWNVLGLTPGDWFDFRSHYFEPDQHRSVVDKARRAGALTIYNHPYDIDFRHDKSPMDGIEVWNNRWDERDEKSVDEWDAMLRLGYRKFIIGGSDFHRMRDTLGRPQTVVLADSLSQSAILRGIARGASYVAKNSAINLSVVVWSALCPDVRASFGETVVARGELWLEVGGTIGGKAVRVITDRQTIVATPHEERLLVRVPPGSKWVRVELREQSGEMLALGNPTFLVER